MELEQKSSLVEDFLFFHLLDFKPAYSKAYEYFPRKQIDSKNSKQIVIFSD